MPGLRGESILFRCSVGLLAYCMQLHASPLVGRGEERRGEVERRGEARRSKEGGEARRGEARRGGRREERRREGYFVGRGFLFHRWLVL